MIKCLSFTADASGAVVELACELVDTLPEGTAKPKAWIQWISFGRGDVPPYCEARLYGPLFKPGSEGQAYEDRFDPTSEEIVMNAMAEPFVLQSPPQTCFQLERVGFFTVDTDSTPQRPILNRTITLKEADWEAKPAAAADAADGAAPKGRVREAKDPEKEAAKAAAKEAQRLKRAAAKEAWLAAGGAAGGAEAPKE